jgi:hypothetical protein
LTGVVGLRTPLSIVTSIFRSFITWFLYRL